jgi:hypothetical protein
MLKHDEPSDFDAKDASASLKIEVAFSNLLTDEESR